MEENKLPKGFRWMVQMTGKRNRKGRAMGGLLMGIKEGIKIEERDVRREMKGIVARVVKLGGVRWRIVGIYVNGDMERKLENLSDWMEEKEGVRTLVGEGF